MMIFSPFKFGNGMCFGTLASMPSFMIQQALLPRQLKLLSDMVGWKVAPATVEESRAFTAMYPENSTPWILANLLCTEVTDQDGQPVQSDSLPAVINVLVCIEAETTIFPT